MQYTIIKNQKLSSTNDAAKKLLQHDKPKEFTVISAIDQLIGRGQQKNSWHSEAGENLTFSIILYPKNIEVNEQFHLSKVISIGILNYLQTKLSGIKIKWPNDIIYEGKKICGILIENSVAGSKIKNTIVGIGLNINQKEFPEYLPDAVSLSSITGSKYNIDEEIKELLDFIYKEYNSFLLKKQFNTIDQIYLKHMFRLNEIASYKDKNGMFKGIITGTDKIGRLIIKTLDEKIRTYNFKEVEYK